MVRGTHDLEDNARNEPIHVWVDGELVRRERAVVPGSGAGSVRADGVWEVCACGRAIRPSWSAILTACSLSSGHILGHGTGCLFLALHPTDGLAAEITRGCRKEGVRLVGLRPFGPGRQSPKAAQASQPS
jgi:hypothetical protein